MSQKKNVFVLIPISCDAGAIKASVHVALFYVLVTNSRHCSLEKWKYQNSILK